MARIDVSKLSQLIEVDPDPFNFYLYLTISNNGELDENNPYKDDKDFLSTLISHYEAEENYELCVSYIRRLKLIAKEHK